jgi:hypothetical protein
LLRVSNRERQGAREGVAYFRFDLNAGILLNQSESGAQDGRTRAQVLVEHDAARVGIKFEELFKGSAGCAAEAEDRLVGIADSEDVVLISREQCHQFDLATVAVLELVYQDEACASTLLSQARGIGAQQTDGRRNHLSVEDPAIFFENGFYFGEDTRDLVAARQHFVARGLVIFLELANTRKREVAFTQALDVGSVVGGGLQLIIAPVEQFQQVMQELARIARLAEVVQLQVMDVLPQIDPEVFFFDMAIILTGALEHPFAVAVNGVCVNFFQRGAGPGRDALLQLTRSVAHVGDAKDLMVFRYAVADQARHSLDQHSRLARARAGDDQHGAVLVLDRDLLLRVGGE